MGNILTRINQHELRVEGVMIDLDNVLLETGKEKARQTQLINTKLNSALSTVLELQDDLNKVNETGGCTPAQHYQSFLRLQKLKD